MAEIKKAVHVEYCIPVQRNFLQGKDLLHNRQYNKDTAFTRAERIFLNLEGLLPEVVNTQEEQQQRVMNIIRNQATDLDRYSILAGLDSHNQKLFYSTLQANVIELLPIVYTPTVGLACQKFGRIYQQSRGMYISLKHLGRVKQVLRHWSQKDIQAIVFTDGQRILGLGDLGAQGMGIPIGKMSLYTALGGVDPSKCLPVTLDVGTNNEELLKDPMYTGLKQKRATGPEYDELVAEFITSCRELFGETILLQFEDFGNANAFRLLRQYEDKCTTFNDDIQGTAGVVVAGVITAVPASGVAWEDHRFLFYGAGGAGLGIAELLAEAVSKNSKLTLDEARANIWAVDSRGLIFKGRKSGGINADKAPFAHEWKDADALGGERQPLEVYVKSLGITGMFGVSAQGGAFQEAAIKQLAANTETPLVFALSNPTSKAECTAEQAYGWTNGKCLFASGSPFPKWEKDGMVRIPGQGNNSYVFPGVALAVIATKATRVRNSVFLTAAEALAGMVTEDDLKTGTLYPSLSKIRSVSAHIAAAVATSIYDDGLATVLPRPADMLAFVKSKMWSAKYESFAPAELEAYYSK